MLPKSKRASKEDFRSTKRASIYANNELLSLRALENNSSISKISFSVSKKVSKSAVVRNRLRRMGYKAIKDLILGINNYIIIISFKKIPEDNLEVEKNLNDILIKSKIIK